MRLASDSEEKQLHGCEQHTHNRFIWHSKYSSEAIFATFFSCPQCDDRRFDSEIVPLMAKSKGKDGGIVEKMVSKDEGIRVGVTLEQLGKINPAFQHGGSTTAGNASQVLHGKKSEQKR